MGQKLEDLTPETERAARGALAALRLRGIQHVVTDTFRTYENQAAKYAQGRESLEAVNAKRSIADLPPITERENAYTVTSCDGVRLAAGGKGRSPHQLGTALDVVPDLDPSERERPGWPPVTDPRWLAIAEAFEAHGFEWGGRWTAPYSPDCPHYQLKA